MTAPARYCAIYAVVRRVPRGSVATYGQVAGLAGLDGHARLVGYALHALPAGSRVPWHRVVNAHGRVSRRSEAHADLDQRMRLEAEGISFDVSGRLDLKERRWHPGN